LAGKDLPGSYDEWVTAARAALDGERYSYVTSAAGGGQTANGNLEAFKRWKLVPRVLRDVSNRSTALTLLGIKASAPLFFSPIRGLDYIRHGGDISVARVAADLGIPFVISSFATVPLEKVAEVMGSAPRWFQLYPGKDKEIMKSLVHRAETSGYTAVVVTVDKAENYPHYDAPKGHEFERHGFELYFSDPVFRARFEGAPERKFEAAYKYWKDVRLAPGLPLTELRMIIEETRLPVLVKGILSSEDAVLAVKEGAAGLVVSNHGGRALEGEVASLDALLEVRKVLKPDFPVLLDSGVRSGTDMLKALALGADAVMIGKAYALALGVMGEEGVRRATKGLIAEFDAAMALCGATNLAEIGRTMVTSG